LRAVSLSVVRVVRSQRSSLALSDHFVGFGSLPIPRGMPITLAGLLRGGLESALLTVHRC
jgi:hypothetical protein